MKSWNLIISAISVAVGMLIIYMSSGLSISLGENPGAGFWPALLGGVLIFTGILLAIISVIRKTELEKIVIILNAPANKKVYIMMGIIIIFCVLLYLLGFYVSIVAFIPVTMLLMGVKSKKEIALTTFFTVLFVFLVFEMLLNVALPKPFFWG